MKVIVSFKILFITFYCCNRFFTYVYLLNVVPFFLAEYVKRLAIFQDNLVRARKMQDMEQGSAKYGVTVFSDLSGLYLT